MTIRESNITINVQDMDNSISFYESIGFTLKQKWSNFYAQLIAPGITIGLHPRNSESTQNGSGNISIGFTTDDLEDIRSILDELSIKVLERKEAGGHFLHFEDPDGTALYFIKPK